MLRVRLLNVWLGLAVLDGILCMLFANWRIRLVFKAAQSAAWKQVRVEDLAFIMVAVVLVHAILGNSSITH
jgi:hypothetical protein